MDSQIPPTDPFVQNADALPPAPEPRYGIFIGPHGLRAGWKCTLFFVITIGLTALFIPLAMRALPHVPHEQPPLRTMLAQEVIVASIVLLVTGLLAKLVDKKKWGYFGLPLNEAFRSKFWIGAVVGFSALAIQLELMHLGGWFDFGSMVLHGGTAMKYGAIWGVLFLCTGLFEEGFLRGYPQRVLTDGMRFWPAALLLSVIFAASHVSNKGENWFGIFMVFVDGMLMCFALWRTGNMWFGVGAHAAWDWGQTFFFGTPDSGLQPMHALFAPAFHGPTLLSGGTDGPEGSVLVMLAEGLIALFLVLVYRRRQYPLPVDAASIAIDPTLSQNLTVTSEGYPPPPSSPNYCFQQLRLRKTPKFLTAYEL